MLTNDHFYHRTLYKLVNAIGSLFDDIYITRTNSSNQEVQRIKVPITYGPKEKWLVRLQQDPELLKEKSIILPRMGFEMTTVNPDPERQFNKTHRRTFQSSVTTRYYQYNPTPWNVHFTLFVLTKTVEDGNQIVEQILPFFHRAWTVTINAIPEMNLKDDVPIILDSITQEDTYDGGFEQRRVVTWNLNFISRINFYGPITDQSIIRKVMVDFHIPPGATPITSEEIQSTPRIARVQVEPDPIDAEPEDDYGYTETLTEYDDGKKFDPVLGIDVPVAGNTVLISPSRLATYRHRITIDSE